MVENHQPSMDDAEQEHIPLSPEDEKKIQAPESFSLEQAEQMIKQADEETRALQNTGLKTAESIAKSMHSEVDAETRDALNEVAAEAETAEAELKAELSETPETKEPQVEQEKKPDFQALSAELTEVIAPFLGADGQIDEAAFGNASPETQAQVQKTLQRFEETVQSHPAEFLTSTGALKALKEGPLSSEIGRFVDKAASQIADNDPEAAYDAYESALATVLRPDELKSHDLASTRKNYRQRFVRKETERILERVEGDPLSGANEMQKLLQRAKEYDVAGPSSYEQEKVAEKVLEKFTAEVAAGNDGVDFYRQITDTAPGHEKVAWKLLENAFAKEPQQEWEAKKKMAATALGERAPEVLLLHATGYYNSGSWTPEEQIGLIEKINALPDGKKSVLAQVSIREMPNDLPPEVRASLFEAYRAGKPETVIEYAERFPEEIAALPENERDAMVDGAIKGDPFSIVRQADGWRGVLSEKQMKNLAVTIASKDSAYIKSHLELALKKLPEMTSAFTPDVIDTITSSNPESTLILADSGTIAIDERQRKALLVGLASQNRLYGHHVGTLEKIGALAPDAVDAVIDGYPDTVIRRLADKPSATEKRLPVSEAQAKQAVTRSFELGHVNPWDIKNIQAAMAEQGLKFNETDVWKLVDASLSTSALHKPEVIGLLRELAVDAGPKLTKLVNTAERITKSPSASLRRLSRELIGQLRNSEDPEGDFAQVEGIFERNQLPLVGKVSKVFEVLYPKEKLDELAQAEHCSPTLRAESHRERMMTFYKDLLSIHLDSNNPSLRGYLETLKEGQGLMDKVDTEGIDALTEQERGRFDSAVEKLKRLHESSLAGRTEETEGPSSQNDTLAVYQGLRTSMSAKEGQTLSGRVAEMYLKPLQLESVDAALERMDGTRKQADQRNRELASAGRIEIKKGDLLKGFGADYLRNVLENGSVAREFLGASADSDLTPFDTDLARVTDDELSEGFPGVMKKSPAAGYGEMIMIIRDRGQFTETSKTDDPAKLAADARKRKSQLELFHTGIAAENHYGVRTGLPSSEIDAFVVTDRLANDRGRLDSRIMDIVANGVYIPVVDQEGRVLFTPEQFDENRKRFFGGIEGEPFRARESEFERAPAHEEALDAVIQEKRREKGVVEGMNAELRAKITAELAAKGVQASSGFDEMLSNAEIYDTGSSSRGTNVPGSYDFDYIVKLNELDMAKTGPLNEALVQKLGGTLHEGHRVEQLRVLGAKFGDETADVDVGFVSKAEGQQYESHDAVRDRLNAVRDELGEEAHEKVVANIVLAKKLLKEGGAYKKFEEGGIGGIGVENWVLSEGGSALAAFEAFEKAAFDGDTLRPLEELQNAYKVIDPGINAKTGGHDNFIAMLKPDGYPKMAATVRSYLEKVRKSAGAAGA